MILPPAGGPARGAPFAPGRNLWYNSQNTRRRGAAAPGLGREETVQEFVSALQAALAQLLTDLGQHEAALAWFQGVVRYVFPILALLILVRAIRGLVRIPYTSEKWGQLSLPGGGGIPICHWENILGRGAAADIRLNLPTVSRQHAALIRGDEGEWQVTDLGSKAGTQVNGKEVTGPTPIRMGDTLSVGGVQLLFLPLSREEEEALKAQRRAEAPLSMWPSFLCLTVFQILAAAQLLIQSRGEETHLYPLALLGLTGVMWLYYLLLRSFGVRGFEMESIAFFLSTLSLAVTASSAPGSVFKQFVAIVLGLLFMLALGVVLRDGRAHPKAALADGGAGHRPAGHHTGGRADQVWRGQLDLSGPHLLSAVGNCQDLLYLCRRGGAGAAVSQAQPGAVHPAHPARAWCAWR